MYQTVAPTCREHSECVGSQNRKPVNKGTVSLPLPPPVSYLKAITWLASGPAFTCISYTMATLEKNHGTGGSAAL